MKETCTIGGKIDIIYGSMIWINFVINIKNFLDNVNTSNEEPDQFNFENAIKETGIWKI